MTVLRLLLVMALTALAASAQQTSSQPASPQTESVPASCPVTPRPATAFLPPADFHPEKLPDNIF